MIKRCIMIFPRFDNMEVINEITTLDLKEHLTKSLNGFKEFNLQLQGISAGKGNYMFLNVALGRNFLIELQRRIYGGVLEQYIPKFLDLDKYIPHLTVGRISDETEFNAALNKCSRIDDIFIDKIKNISVEIIDENENSTIELTIDLEQ